MLVDYLIIGQGISGTFLSYYLQQEKKSFLVIDHPLENSPSRIAAGLINPVTGRRLVTVWMADELLPFAWKAYQEIGRELGITAISAKSIVDFFPNPFMRESFLKRMEEDSTYLHTYPDQNDFNPYFQFEFGCGEIRPSYIAHLETLLPAWRDRLNEQQLLREEYFEAEHLQLREDCIHYKDITAGTLIFCDGAGGAENPFFKQLPFAPNKGEALVVEIPGLPEQHIYKRSMILAPMAEPGLFWLGSSYEWNFTFSGPSPAFRKQAEQVLKQWLKGPFHIRDHRAGIRPATLERRPFVGLHPLYQQIGILNGMGTKGCSLAPFFARQLADLLVYHMPLSPEADIHRFHKILTRE